MDQKQIPAEIAAALPEVCVPHTVDVQRNKKIVAGLAILNGNRPPQRDGTETKTCGMIGRRETGLATTVGMPQQPMAITALAVTTKLGTELFSGGSRKARAHNLIIR